MFENKKDKKDKEPKNVKGASENSLTYSQEIAELLDTACKMLDSAPQTVEVRSSIIHLKAAQGSLAQAGKFKQILD